MEKTSEAGQFPGRACVFPRGVSSVRVQRDLRWAEFAELSGLFFLLGLGMGAWFVPLGPVLDAHGMGGIKPYAFASSSMAALVSPLFFGALADRRSAPVRVLGWLAVAAAAMMVVVATAIHWRVNQWLVLGLIQVLALCLSPTWSLTTSVVLGRMSDAQRQFGPVRALGTLGWMAGCWAVSLLRFDDSAAAACVSAGAWVLLAVFTWVLPGRAPASAGPPLTLRERFGLDALGLLKHRDHRVVFVTAALFAIPMAAFYPHAPSHLKELGLERTAAWMSIGQVTEIIAMVWLSSVLVRWRLKWTLAAGLAFGVIRYSLSALDGPGWVLAGVSLHGLAFTLFFITAQIYLDQRVDPAWRARAQALFNVVLGVGNLCGYLGTGWWFRVSQQGGMENWSRFWGGLALVVGLVWIFFMAAYRGNARRSEPN